MELFDLIAKLTLDSSEYKSALREAEDAGASLEDASVGLDTSDFTGALDDAEGEAEGFSTSVGSILDGIKGAIATAGIGLAIKEIIEGLTDAVNLAAKLGDDVDKGSRRLNISTEAYQEWGHALSQSGANINDFSRGIISMNKYLAGTDVSAEVSEAFTKLGMDARIANGEIGSTEELLTETVKRLADFPGTKEERGALATAIFGRGGNTLNALFDSGSEGIQQLIDEAHELGLVMTDEEIANSVAYGDAVANLQSAVDGLKTSFVTGILPDLTKAVEMVTQIVAFFNPRAKGENTLSDMFADTDANAAESLATIEETSAVASNLADKLIAMGDASKLTADQQAVWKGTAEELIKLVPTLSEVIDTDTLKINGNTEEIQNNIKEWKNLAKQRALNEAIEEKQKAMYDKNKEAIDAQVEAIRTQSKAEEKRKDIAKQVNEMLKEGTDLGDSYGKTLDENGDVLSQLYDLLDFSATTGHGDYTKIEGLYNELAEVEDAASEAQEKFDSYSNELAEAQEEFDAWVGAASELFGVLSEDSATAQDEVAGVNEALNGLPAHKTVRLNVISNMDGLNYVSNAKGNWDVPYDMPAILHRGETVLTTSEAREYREGTYEGGSSSDVVGAIQGMRNDLQNLRLVVGTRTFGRAVVDYSGNRMDEYIGRAEDRVSSGYGT